MHRLLLARRPAALAAGVAVVIALGGTSAAAQGTDAVIAGIVRTGDQPAAGVTVTVRNEATGLQQVRTTNAAGRYTVAQLPVGGPYTVTARLLGYRPTRQGGLVLRLGDRAPVDFALEPAPTELSAVVVTDAAAQTGRAARVGASTIIQPREIEQIPAQNRSFTDLALLAPTTSPSGTGGVITSSSSIAGGRVTATDIRVDGVQAKNGLWGAGYGRGPFSLSMEAVREFEIVTNVYDVTQGRQGGGALNVATRAGTNRTQGSFFAFHRNADLTTTNFQGIAPLDFRNTQWGGSIGGPVLRDRLHYFVAVDRQDLSEPFSTMDVRNPADETQYNVARDSVQRFVQILESRYGLPQGQQVGQFRRASVLNTVFGRADWVMSDRHRLTLRHTYSDWLNPNSLTDRFLAVRESFGTAFSRENQTLLTVASAFGGAASNELRLAYTDRTVQNREDTRIPRGWVQVRSSVPDGTGGTRTTSTQTLQFGGMRTTPEWQTDRSLQLVDVARFERGNATYLLGTDNSLNRQAMYLSIETNGRFLFPSLAALEQGRPSEYYRLVPVSSPEPSVDQWVLDAGVFAQGDWRLSRRLTASAGVRWDVSSFLTRAAYNPLLEQELGIRNDRRAVDWRGVQPRGQVVWNVTGTGRDVIRAGAGLFTAQPHQMVQINNLLNDGLQLREVLLTGATVPSPDFVAYRRDLAAVPGVPTGTAESPAYVNVMGDGFRVPRTFKTDLAWQHRIGTRAQVGLSAQYARTTSNYHYYDRNLVDPFFRLDNEQGRAVFVPADRIPTSGASGAGAVTALSRRSPRFARVLELRSDAVQDQRAAIADFAVQPWRDALVAGSYTYNRTRENSAYNCCIAVSSSFTPVASDPRDLSGSWGPSGNDFRHKVVLFGSMPSVWGFRVSGRYVGVSGAPFSAMVAGDVNGDELNNNNDLAMIFDPNDPSLAPAVAASLRKVLENPQNEARDYLRDNLGRIAPRNGARNRYFGRLDLRLAKSVPSIRGQRAELTVDVFNFANLLNREWGGQWVVPAANQTLLSIAGFDPSTRRYRYAVNENYGVARKQGDPYQIQAGDGGTRDPGPATSARYVASYPASQAATWASRNASHLSGLTAVPSRSCWCSRASRTGATSARAATRRSASRRRCPASPCRASRRSNASSDGSNTDARYVGPSSASPSPSRSPTRCPPPAPKDRHPSTRKSSASRTEAASGTSRASTSRSMYGRPSAPSCARTARSTPSRSPK